MRCIISENICRAVLNRAGSFHMCHSDRKRYKDDEMKKKGICRLADPKELPGEISIRLFRTSRPGLPVTAKIILAALRYFCRKPCLS